MGFFWLYDSPFGTVNLGSTDGEHLTRLTFLDMHCECVEKELPIFDEAMRWMDIYFGGKEPDFTPALKVGGTKFQKQICERLLKIPYAQTISYGELASEFPKKMAAQAVGGAVGRNPIALIIPCHRVIGANGELGGYAFGTDLKRALLKLEGVEI